MKTKTYIRKAGKQLARLLQDKSERLSVTGKKCLLALFCSVFVGCSMLVIIHSIKDRKPVYIQPINIPPAASIPSQKAIISRQEFEHIEQFKNQLDSKISPGLMDSIHRFEEMYLYQSPSKK